MDLDCYTWMQIACYSQFCLTFVTWPLWKVGGKMSSSANGLIVCVWPRKLFFLVILIAQNLWFSPLRPPSPPMDTVQEKYVNTLKLAEDFSIALRGCELADVMFIVGEDRIPLYGVKAILACRSRYVYSCLLIKGGKGSVTAILACLCTGACW